MSFRHGLERICTDKTAWIRQMNRKQKRLLFAFVVFHVVGMVVPMLWNVHSNAWPLFAYLLLIPGIAVAFLVPHTSTVTLALVSISINAVVWYLAAKWRASRNPDSYWPGA
jgi:hypothetical protein